MVCSMIIITYHYFIPQRGKQLRQIGDNWEALAFSWWFTPLFSEATFCQGVDFFFRPCYLLRTGSELGELNAQRLLELLDQRKSQLVMADLNENRLFFMFFFAFFGLVITLKSHEISWLQERNTITNSVSHEPWTWQFWGLPMFEKEKEVMLLWWLLTGKWIATTSSVQQHTWWFNQQGWSWSLTHQFGMDFIGSKPKDDEKRRCNCNDC